MAGEDLQALTDLLEVIAGAQQAAWYDFHDYNGLRIGRWPPELHADLTELYTILSGRLLQVAVPLQGLYDLEVGRVLAGAGSEAEAIANLNAYVYGGLMEINGSLAVGLKGEAHSIATALQDLHSLLMGFFVTWSIYGWPGGGAAGGGPGGGGGLAQELAAWHGPVTVDAGRGWSELYPELRDAMGKLAAAFGPPPERTDIERLAEEAIQQARTAGHFNPGWLEQLFTFPGADPDDGIPNALKAYGLTTGLGLAAAGLAALKGSIIAGTGPIGLGNLTAVVGDMAGYTPITRAIVGSICNTWINTPLGHYMRAKGRPTLPGVGETLQLYWQRKLPDSPGGPSGPPAPRTAKELLEFAGYPDPWIKVLLNNADRDPGLRELVGIALETDKDDEWAIAHLRELGYNEEDLPDMLNLLWYRVNSGYYGAYADELGNQVQRGYISKDTMRELLAALGLSQQWITREVNLADERGWRRLKDREVQTILDNYESGTTTDDLFEQQLREIVVQDNIATATIAGAKAARYQKAPLYNEYGAAREQRQAARRLVVLGLLDWRYYQHVLEALLFPDEVIEREHALVDEERSRQIIADLRAHIKSSVRDQVVLGEMSVADYAQRLSGMDVAPDVARAELAYVALLQRRYAEGRMQRWELPGARAAYVEGVIGPGAVLTLMEEAGLNAKERGREMMRLDILRNKAQQQRQAQQVKLISQARKQEERKARQEAKAAEKERPPMEPAEDAAARKQRQTAAAAAKALAQAAYKLAGAKDPRAAEVAEYLLPQIQEAYDRAEALMGDDVWAATESLENVLGAGRALDPDALWAAVQVLSEALDSEAGAPPTP